MRAKWLQYFENILPIFLVASLLNPYVKLTGTITLLEGIYYTYLEISHINILAMSTIAFEDLHSLYKVKLWAAFG